MKIAHCQLTSVSPYGQGRMFQSPKDPNETHDAYEQRVWRERCHVDADGSVYIPPQALKACLEEAAKYKPKQIPGKGKATYTKHFESGVMCLEPIPLGVQVNDILCHKQPVPPSGVHGDGKRVWKNFPYVPKWSGVAVFHVLDDLIDKKTFEECLVTAGQFIGIGVYRPKNRGFWGRFRVVGVEWKSE